MTTTTERRGLGRGLGELFQRTEPLGAPVERVGTAPAPADVAPTRADVSDVGQLDERAADDPVAAPEQARRSSLPEGVTIPDGAYFAELAIGSITPNPRQPRSVFDEDAMAELVDSIREVGLLQPIVVRPLGEGRFELVMGERRWRASREAGEETVPAIVRETKDHDLLRDALLENLHRAQLNPLEEAAAYSQMLEDFGCTQEELATRIKRSRPQISNTIRLLKLPASVQRRVAAGVLSAGHARAILMVDGIEAQERLAQRTVAEGLSVRAVEELAVMHDALDDLKPARARAARAASPETLELASRLSDYFETRVRIDVGRAKGKITIEFASTDDLRRIIDAIKI